jgi:hypothetical protein
MVLSFTIAAGLRQRSHSKVRVPRDSGPHFTVSDSRILQPGGLGPVFISLMYRVTRLFPQALGSLFVASYDSQGYGGGNRSCFSLYSLRTERVENTAPQLLQRCVLRICCGHHPATAVVYRAITEHRLYGCLFRGRFLAMGLYAKI